MSEEVCAALEILVGDTSFDNGQQFCQKLRPGGVGGKVGYCSESRLNFWGEGKGREAGNTPGGGSLLACVRSFAMDGCFLFCTSALFRM